MKKYTTEQIKAALNVAAEALSIADDWNFEEVALSANPLNLDAVGDVVRIMDLSEKLSEIAGTM